MAEEPKKKRIAVESFDVLYARESRAQAEQLIAWAATLERAQRETTSADGKPDRQRAASSWFEVARVAREMREAGEGAARLADETLLRAEREGRA